MSYDQTKYKSLRTLQVPFQTALALADDAAPDLSNLTALAAIPDLNTGTATTAQISTTVNLILARLRSQGLIAP